MMPLAQVQPPQCRQLVASATQPGVGARRALTVPPLSAPGSFEEDITVHVVTR